MSSPAKCILRHVTFSISSFHLDRGLRDYSVLCSTYVEVSSVACFCNLFIDVARSNSFFQFTVLQGFVCTMEAKPQWAKASSVSRIHDRTKLDRLSTLGRTHSDARSARLRYLYVTKHTTHSRQNSMLPAGFESTIAASERPQTYALDRVTTRV